MALIPIGEGASGFGYAKYPGGDTGGFSAVDDIFKEFYLPAIRDQLNSQTILKRYLRRNREDIAGETAEITMRTGRNEGIGSVAEGGLLPLPGRQQYERLRYRMRSQYARILITGQSVASSRNDRGAFTRVLDSEIRGAVQDRMHEDNRILFGNGSGALAVASGTGAGTTQAIINPGGFVNSGDGAQYIREGMILAAWDESAGAFDTGGADAATVTAVDRTPGANTITLSSSVTWDADSLVVRASDPAAVNQKDTGVGNEPYGLAAIVDDDNIENYPVTAAPAQNLLGGVDATATNVWNSVVIDNGGTPRAFQQDFIQQAEDGVQQVSGDQVDLLVTTFGVRRQYLNQLVQSKRFPNTMSLDGGFTALEYNGRPLVPDKDCTRGRLYGLNLDAIMMFDELDYQWIDSDGSVLSRLDDYDAYQASLVGYWQVGCDSRNRHFVIKDIDD